MKQGHNISTCIFQREGHMPEATRNNTTGRKMWNKCWDKWWNVCDKLVDNNINIIGTTNTIPHNYNVDNLAAADSGKLGYFLKSNSPCVNKRTAINPLGICIPDLHIIYSSHTSLIHQNTLPIEAQQAHIFPDLKNKALLSISMFCDNGCLALFDDKKVYIIDKRTNKNIMHGTCDNKSTLYMVPPTPKKTKIWRNAKFLSVILPLIYTRQNQKLTWALFSTLRAGSHAHL